MIQQVSSCLPSNFSSVAAVLQAVLLYCAGREGGREGKSGRICCAARCDEGRDSGRSCTAQQTTLATSSHGGIQPRGRETLPERRDESRG